LNNGSAGAASVRQIDPSIEWKSTAPSNLVATVERQRLPEIVRQIHDRLF
jgi:hypothetical protein